MQSAYSESGHGNRIRVSQPACGATPDSVWLQAIPVALFLVSAAGMAWVGVCGEPIAWSGLVIDRVTAVLAVLVSGIGIATLRYALRCLEGNPRRATFLRWMGATVASAWILAVADSVPILVAAWMAVGIGLDRLLRFCGDRPGAAITARRKFIVSRLGDSLLIAAFATAWCSWGTLSVTTTSLAAGASSTGPALTAFALLVCLAASAKSAQVPLHGWLPDTMEAPTPVSALMHAGIVNAGGALLVRLAPALVRVPEAWLLLSCIGTASILIAVPATWVQARAKTALAWSTVSQMGFMLVQCGLCAFPAVLLHIFGHGAYKAWSFLRAGHVPPAARAAPPSASRALVLLALGTAAAVPAIAAWATVTGLDRAIAPGKLALLAVVAIAVGQGWIGFLGERGNSGGATALRIAAALAFTVVAPGVACVLYVGAGWWVAPVVGTLPHPDGPVAWAAAIVPVTAIAILAVVHASMPALERRALGQALRIHAISGFYLGIVVGRVLDRAFAMFRHPMKGFSHA